jgi:hypothetical protein
MVFNELCLLEELQDKYQVRELMSKLIKTLRQAKIEGLGTKIITYIDFNNINFLPDYPLAKWRNDPEVDQFEKTFIRSIQFNSLKFDEIADQYNEVLYELENYPDQYPQGLSYAYENELLCISIETKQLWNHSIIVPYRVTIDDNDGSVEVKHASNRNHIFEHQEWIKKRLKINLNNGLELWNKRKDLFPHLDFCESVEKQLQNLQNSEPIFHQIIRKLEELENASKNWLSGDFKLNSLSSKASPESESRLQKFAKKLTFQCPDGETRLFSLHIRMTPGAWRLHFYPLKPNQIIIGYVGMKIQ